MDYTLYFWIFLIFLSNIWRSSVQHEDIPYQDVDVKDICNRCECDTDRDENKGYHHILKCSTRNFKHILAAWPPKFGKVHNDMEIIAIYSGNTIPLLQQLPATNGTVTLSCRHCSIEDIQAPLFVDVPNILRVDLSWNNITEDVLTPDVFRGKFNSQKYEPIQLQELDLSRNQITSLDRLVFEHTPELRRLNLAYNKFKIMDEKTVAAISSLPLLEFLDLSYNAFKTLPKELFKPLINLESLQLQGNQLVAVPDGLSLVGRTLEVLNLANNPLLDLKGNSFEGLKVLKNLNISEISNLRTVVNEAFSKLESLEYLTCSNNPNISQFDMKTLLHCQNLTFLDLSNCGLETIKFEYKASNETKPISLITWPKLEKFETSGNLWKCNCDLMKTFDQFDRKIFDHNQRTRCNSPFILSGTLIFNLTTEFVCTMPIPKKYIIPDDDPPRFLRPKYIALTIITISAVIAIGTIVGFAIVYIRRKLKNDDFGVSPIRYTTVRNSTT